MRTPARPRLPDGDCVFISDVRIVARADAPFIAADKGRTMTRVDRNAYMGKHKGGELCEVF